MAFFKANIIFIYLLAFTINIFFLSSIYLATKHANIERDISKIKKSYLQLSQENENLKINNKIKSEKKVFSNGVHDDYRKKTVKEIPIIKLF